MRNKQDGFSLIELLIVVAIILIIAAIAIPNLLRSKMAANEASAVASCRTINTAEVVYSNTYNVPSVFSTDLASLAGTACSQSTPPTSTSACLIDPALALAGTAPGKSGYTFAYVGGSGTYTVNANPLTAGSTGVRYFFTDQSNVIRQDSAGPATNGSSPI
jgi:prepilin-type N-terminal cleavage/methylation domain-containing protein